MEFGTKVFSSEIIKPCSPTPKSQQKHHVSYIDQLLPPSFISFIYFYSSNTKIPNSQKSNILKKSLSEVLPIFYPLAGRLVDYLYVDCNDDGVGFFEAEADCNLSQVITNPNPKNMINFVPYKFDEPLNVCMAAQATYYRCGGVAVGIQINHKIADALSMANFANAWSAVARSGGSGGLPIPKFDGAAYFPPRKITGIIDPRLGIKEEDYVPRIFTFPAAKIAQLQEKYSGSLPGRRPTRVEALSAYLSTRFLSNPNKKYLMQSVDIRSRADPPLSGSHFGNFFWIGIAELAARDDDVEILLKVREAVKAVDAGYVAQLKGGGENRFVNEVTAKPDKIFAITSISGFPFYEVDFGWGKPVWIGLEASPFKNTVVLNGTKSGGAIEALINLPKQDMEKFETDFELQPFIRMSKI